MGLLGEAEVMLMVTPFSARVFSDLMSMRFDGRGCGGEPRPALPPLPGRSGDLGDGSSLGILLLL